MAHLFANLDVSSCESESFIPSDKDIHKAVGEITCESNIDLPNLSLKQCLRMVARKLGCSVDDLQSKQLVVKTALKEEVAKHEAAKNEGFVPSKEQIKAAALELTNKVDMEKTSFKKFMKLLADDLDVEDLAPAKSIIKKVYDAAEEDSEATAELPCDDDIVHAAKKLAYSDRVDLEDITQAKFFRMLQKRMGGIDLSARKKLITDTLKTCKANHSKSNKSLRAVELDDKPQKEIDDSFASSTISNTDARHYDIEEAVMLVAMNNVNQAPESAIKVPKKRNPRCSHDLEYGQNIKQAIGLKWIDDFFDGDTDDLVAVFDHDYKAMINYEMKVIVLSKILPIALVLIFFVALIIVAGNNLVAVCPRCTIYMLKSWSSIFVSQTSHWFHEHLYRLL